MTTATRVLELRNDAARVKIDPPSGGRMVSLFIGGSERLLQKENARAQSPPLYWGCYPMVPWPGRLGEGRIPTELGEVRLEPNLPPSAIHGLGFDRPWIAVAQTETAVNLECRMRGRGWPFGGRARQTVDLGPDRIDLTLEVGEYTQPGPAGLGWHPWFMRPRTGDIAVRLDAREVLAVDRDLVPTGEVRAVTAAEDLRAGPELGDRRLDHVYVRAKSPALVRWPDLELRIEFDHALDTVVVHTPSEGVCVEPQTMWPNAPLLAAGGVVGTGLRTLEPGESLRVSERWTWRAV